MPSLRRKFLNHPFVSDFRHNFRSRSDKPTILFLRHMMPTHQNFHGHFLNWVRENNPAAFERFRFARIPGLPVSLQKTALLFPWLQDPLKERFPDWYRLAKQVEDRCAQQGIPVINPVDCLSRSIKSVALPLIRQTGARTAHIVPILKPAEFDFEKAGLSLPFFIREDRYHGGPITFISEADDLRKVAWNTFENPVAVEYIETRCADGNYRKYRYVFMGDAGVPRHLVIAREWCVHAEARLLTPQAIEEEMNFTRLLSDPNHEILNRARKLLGMDFVAFDYSYDTEGRLVIWEPNPFPCLWVDYNTQNTPYQIPLMNRLYQTLLQFIFNAGNLVLPNKTESSLERGLQSA